MDVYLRIPSTPLRCVSMWEKLYLTPHLWACKLLLKASRCNMEVLCRVAGDMEVLCAVAGDMEVLCRVAGDMEVLFTVEGDMVAVWSFR